MEVAAILQSYRDAMVLIGGWVPYLLLQQHKRPDNPFRHVGSVDSDWLIDPDCVDPQEYDTIVGSLKRRGFAEDPAVRYRLTKSVSAEGVPEPFEVAVDLLTTALPKGKGSARRHRTIQRGVEARTIEAGALALDHFTVMPLEGKLLSGGQLELTIRMADVTGSLGTKGLALGRRFDEKDSYDVYALIANYGAGPVEVAGLVRPFLGEPLLEQALAEIGSRFESVDAAGPVAVADFFANEAGTARERRSRDAFEVVGRFLRELRVA